MNSLLIKAQVVLVLTIGPTRGFPLAPVPYGCCHLPKRPFPTSRAAVSSDSDDDISSADGAEITSKSALLPSALNDSRDTIETAPFDASTSSSPQVVTMLTGETKRILIEDLGYSRRDVNRMRVELAGPILEKRIRSPAGQKMPEEWLDPDLIRAQQQMDRQTGTSNSSMLDRLENESKYPLKVPLLGISLILAGKGVSDAGITFIKVHSNFPGASLSEEFMGVPVLLIDFLCVGLGLLLGSWTWTSMRDHD